MNKRDLLALNLSGTYSHKTGTRHPSCVTPRHICCKIYQRWDIVTKGKSGILETGHERDTGLRPMTSGMNLLSKSVVWVQTYLFFKYFFNKISGGFKSTYSPALQQSKFYLQRQLRQPEEFMLRQFILRHLYSGTQRNSYSYSRSISWSINAGV